MSCTSCSTKDGGVPNGCKSNGSCGTGSCDKLTVFDWLSNMELPTGQKPFDIVEVRFKNGRKHFYKNEKNFQLTIGEVVAVEGNPGHDIGTISLTGELVKIQMKKKKVAVDSEEVKKIYRKATIKDIETWETARNREIETQKRGREIIIRLGLKMKLSDVEYQGDGNKATFYYTADDRVDFRQLIRELASAFSIRVEMKQVGLRQEAARLGGVGSCGRELCCSTWLTDFRKVNTAAARYQQLSLNPQKLAGQCGKLKCCLNYELDTYLDALKGFPSQSVMLKTVKGLATFVKMDIFKETLWYTYKDDKSKWFKLTLEQVQEILEENKQGNTVDGLEEYDAENIEETKVDFENVVGQDSLTRFDEPKQKSKRRKNNRSKNKASGSNQPRPNAPRANSTESNKPPVRKPNHPSKSNVANTTVSSEEKGNQPTGKRPNNRRRNNANKSQGDKVNPKAKLEANTNTDVNQPNKPRPKRKPQRKKSQTDGVPQKGTNPNQPVGNAEKTNEGTPNANKPKRRNNRKRPNKPNNGPAKSE
ncbi:regulatory iron-sulfur-containing complex subunit RicT [Wenyingzhuangia sp. chi5]|uniref:Regulatory iron-sulfur-containing complex subunit RicT n=1 Tax=Wenyingzhuangia gilva TaxID=3057677 RepID=A0ABT8VQ66_9FLAO|nr:regulatory iron-sulfur-containing complex subunit RicT [Wenyingzhuangia sp. chi5]MDO3694105.1 regulatory iron-sulfur-containing complex subunit RicT [Wenyingzhuangia sp. chi5]